MPGTASVPESLAIYEFIKSKELYVLISITPVESMPVYGCDHINRSSGIIVLRLTNKFISDHQ